MKKEKIVGLAVLTLILTAGISTAFADVETRGFGRGFSDDHRAQMTEVFENGTYQDWVDLANQNYSERSGLMQERHDERMSQVTEENFGQLAEAHSLMQAGDYDGARAIMDELGLDRGLGARGNGFNEDGFGRGMRGQGQRLYQNL